MVGPSLIPPDGDDPSAEYVPSAEVLATLPSRNPNLPPGATEGVPGEQYDVEIPGPVQRAAELSDIRILRGLLRQGFAPTSYIVGPLHNPWQSALTNAIQARLPDHVNLLLAHGANPNGFPDWCFLAASSRFIRGRKTDTTITAGCALERREDVLRSLAEQGHGAQIYHQSVSLMEAEIEQRKRSRARFWAEPDFPMVDWPTNTPLSALSAAVDVQSPEMYLKLIKSGADEAAWITESDFFHPENGMHVPSRWAVEPPLWVAIRNKDEKMLRFLLERGHKPHLFPETVFTRSYNALMYAISLKWTSGFDIMSTIGNLSLVSPVFGCHLLHFAVATLDLGLMLHVLEKLENGQAKVAAIVRETALGHTLLHIASLPLRDHVVNMHSLPIYNSIHEFRTLDTTWRPMYLSYNSNDRGNGPSSRGRVRGRRTTGASRGPNYQNVPQHQLDAQAEVISYILKILPEENMIRRDIHGNTFLHYLTSIRNPDEVLLTLLRTYSAGEAAWNTITNSRGFTAKNLFQAGQTAKKDWEKREMPFWRKE